MVGSIPSMWFYFGGLALAFVSLILVAIATGTTSWIVFQASYQGNTVTEHLGLFQFCLYTNVEECQSNIGGDPDAFICGDHTNRMTNQFFMSVQSSGVLATLFAAGAIFFALFRKIFPNTTFFGMNIRGYHGLFEAILAGLASLQAFYAWSGFIFIVQYWINCGVSFCDTLTSGVPSSFTTSCGFNYSFALCIIAWIFLAMSCVSFAVVHMIEGRAARAAATTAQPLSPSNYAELIQQ
ncbi:membrane-associated protein, putative [Bodo saltans]|uniref:Membrane-associated protein, putative n=1 Tax=Bodo saltans TaxID=75058 RepID=A0A0S4IZJ2_BODSA|nr:membrane-associated protein, putative [Bodo saltans]|eukprot:CUG67752.1 membrane-associated protein, putative [Bodo saltans]